MRSSKVTVGAKPESKIVCVFRAPPKKVNYQSFRRQSDKKKLILRRKKVEKLAFKSTVSRKSLILISHKWPPVIVTSFEIRRIVWPQMIWRVLLLEEVAAIFVLVGSTKILKQWLIFHFLDNFVQCFVGVHDCGFFLIWLQTTKSQEFGKWSVKLSILMMKLFFWDSSFN